ncbi:MULTISPECIES: type I-E CRISPR-associated protein Cas7/Cse4/CasC [Gilliamella]|uniref:Type I-E CRISPR-associated protein Cas7/Cse4/CasC n=1 Tax=Gilliamella apis TaxID=1970738 RepID=A0A242NUR1_9GAMM|nr:MULTISPECIES: type I-E CRISPR-associated protein Cas7/Cse4/CasC [Gilliamella]MBI0113264.1 type I-E CRISPR-associated protein Cas7/Cse4/CasC [Gilliamella sp. W8123]MBI0116528.1 type I-E CRISPR-associated protein Cas7/Cse4/CasC [Gilliamella sp. W8129]MBI0156483.1 type I-E CRISPR-associated protein Cas7/Cse4/CasC [Gilliamella sp. M0364]OTQ49899.1 type I-E CRISPR-associated protein Cas7/Cse4/CasC [Gilliamella apis]OTQ54909.1 type I-E CRISPR-associated protein Cas7/Cse4/CasC [Gilliamella apis]
MTTFIQLHLLTAYAPSNLNRDDLGRPKTAKMGNTDRLRISSQSLKRAWRTSDCFYQSLSDHIGVRSRRFARDWVYKPLIDNGISEKIAKESAIKIASQFGKVKNEKSPKDPLSNLEIEQLVHISSNEQQAIKQLVDVLISEKREPSDDEVKLLRKENSSIDIALFGRMLADSPAFNIEAACQVSHALGVSTVTIEDDFFTAVDDLNNNDVDAGSAHLGERGFASALFYTYVCISRDLLLENLNGDEALVEKTLKALTESAAKVAPTGMQNSFASRAYTSYLLIEKGSQQPRSLAVAYFNPIRSQDMVNDAISRLEEQRDKFDKVYGQCADSRYVLNSETGEGTLSAALDFVAQK